MLAKPVKSKGYEAGTLTRRQHAILEHLRESRERQAHPPTLDELCRELGLRSRQSVIIRALRSNRYMKTKLFRPLVATRTPRPFSALLHAMNRDLEGFSALIERSFQATLAIEFTSCWLLAKPPVASVSGAILRKALQYCN